MKLFVKNGKPPKARENAADRATIGARFASDWFRGWRKVFLDQSQSEMKQKQKSWVLTTVTYSSELPRQFASQWNIVVI